jgi:hypothetical protein
MRSVALSVRFLLELCLLASFAVWAAHLARPTGERIVVGAAAVAGAAIVWGLVLSPKRRFDPPTSVRLAFEAVFFLAGAAALFDSGRPALALALLLAAIGHRIVLAVVR